MKILDNLPVLITVVDDEKLAAVLLILLGTVEASGLMWCRCYIG